MIKKMENLGNKNVGRQVAAHRNPQPSTLNRKRAAFTIVELLMVITILAILAGIITMGVSGMFRSARQKNAVAMKQILQSALATYYAQKGEWPSGIKGHVDEDEDSYELKDSEAKDAFYEVVSESVKSSGIRCIDPTGLFVASAAKVNEGCHDNHRNRGLKYKFCGDKRCVKGQPFETAVKKGGGERTQHISLRDMVFGYEGPNNGRFCRYRIIFHPRTDSVEVKMQQINEDNVKDD